MPKRTRDQRIASAALLFAALGDPTRLMLLERLSAGGPASISTLADTFRSMTRQGVTKHLQVLAAAGIIDGSRQGREQVWTLNPQRLADGRRHLDLIAAGWDQARSRSAPSCIRCSRSLSLNGRGLFASSAAISLSIRCTACSASFQRRSNSPATSRWAGSTLSYCRRAWAVS